MGFLYSLIGFLIAIAVLVTVHEFGHYYVAKKLGVKILRFSVGFGAPLWKKVAGADNTEYTIAAIPLGGYVKMLGEEDDEYAPEDAHRAFNNQSLWKRAAIVFAGPAINFIFAIVIYAGLMWTGVEGLKPIVGDIPAESVMAKSGLKSGDEIQSIDGKSANYFGEHRLYVFNKVLKQNSIDVAVLREGQPVNVKADLSGISVRTLSPSFMSHRIGLHGVRPKALAEVGRVVEGSPADKAGLLVDDKLAVINGVSVDSWQSAVEAIQASNGQPLSMSLIRQGQEVDIALTPEIVTVGENRIPRVGIGAKVEPIPEEFFKDYRYGLFSGFAKAVEDTWNMSVVSLRMFGKMLTMQASPKNISGPITIAQVAGDAIQVSLPYFLNILAMISISLGVINLLPIPMLDGGHLLYYAVEAATGKPVSEGVQLIGQKIGLFFIASLMCLAFYNDIFRLIG